MRYRRKKQTKKTMECAFMLKKWDLHREEKNAKSKYTHKIHRNTDKHRNKKIWIWISEMLQKLIIVYLYHVGGVSSVSIRR